MSIYLNKHFVGTINYTFIAVGYYTLNLLYKSMSIDPQTVHLINHTFFIKFDQSTVGITLPGISKLLGCTSLHINYVHYVIANLKGFKFRQFFNNPLPICMECTLEIVHTINTCILNNLNKCIIRLIP